MIISIIMILHGQETLFPCLIFPRRGKLVGIFLLASIPILYSFRKRRETKE